MEATETNIVIIYAGIFLLIIIFALPTVWRDMRRRRRGPSQ
jgi:hypothetical protein